LLAGDAALTDPVCNLSPHNNTLKSFVDSIQVHDSQAEPETLVRAMAQRQNPESAAAC
jgi:hypothetical protein